MTVTDRPAEASQQPAQGCSASAGGAASGSAAAAADPARTAGARGAAVCGAAASIDGASEMDCDSAHMHPEHGSGPKEAAAAAMSPSGAAATGAAADKLISSMQPLLQAPPRMRADRAAIQSMINALDTQLQVAVGLLPEARQCPSAAGADP